MMLLSAFRTRVKEKLTDLDTSNPFFSDTRIDNQLDDWIRDNWLTIVRKVPHHYFEVAAFIGVTDAVVSTNNERYTLPTDFRAIGFLQRTDLDHKPKLRFVARNDHDTWRFILDPLYVRDDDAIITSLETWSIFNKTQFQILPAPTATSFTYDMIYYKQHTTAAAGGDTVDIPDDFLTMAIVGVAKQLALIEGDKIAERLTGIEANINANLRRQRINVTQGVIPEMNVWWK